MTTELTPIPTNGSKYDDITRREAAVQMAVRGNCKAVARALDIPVQTIRDWSKTDWFNDIIVSVRAEKSNEHIHRYQELTSKALDKASKAMDRLGDELSAADIKALVVTGATATDKAQLLQRLPTTVRSDSSSVQALAEAFRKLSEDHARIQGSVVSDQ